jgi:hypothetical protein
VAVPGEKAAGGKQDSGAKHAVSDEESGFHVVMVAPGR